MDKRNPSGTGNEIGKDKGVCHVCGLADAMREASRSRGTT
jgi:hypothetical protein